MRAKTVALLTAVAVIALTASGAAALPADELAPENETDNTSVGICVVGVDSPCNGDNADGSVGDQIESNDSDDGQLWIPEDQNRDGEIDERFRGNNDGTETSDTENESTRVRPPAEQDHHSEPNEDSGEGETEIGGGEDTTDRQIFLPEDQNRDGKIDERFGGVPEFLEGLFTSLFGLN